MNYIQELTLISIRTEDFISIQRFNNVQSLTLTTIIGEISYEQMNSFINMSSIKYFKFEYDINGKLFFDILKYHPTQVSVEIRIQNYLEEITRVKKSSRKHLKKIRSLVFDGLYVYPIFSQAEHVENISLYHPNLEELVIAGAVISIRDIIFLLNNLKRLSFLKAKCNDLPELNPWEDLHTWLINQDIKVDKTFVYKQYDDFIYLWIG
ncbi:hypothetical protein I4U23_031513 [Adineta vaga]|nr:hypothetical protein I4U23_031513 [Adineta vaga]